MPPKGVRGPCVALDDEAGGACGQSCDDNRKTRQLCLKHQRIFQNKEKAHGKARKDIAKLEEKDPTSPDLVKLKDAMAGLWTQKRQMSPGVKDPIVTKLFRETHKPPAAVVTLPVTKFLARPVSPELVAFDGIDELYSLDGSETETDVSDVDLDLFLSIMDTPTTRTELAIVKREKQRLIDESPSSTSTHPPLTKTDESPSSTSSSLPLAKTDDLKALRAQGQAIYDTEVAAAFADTIIVPDDHLLNHRPIHVVVKVSAHTSDGTHVWIKWEGWQKHTAEPIDIMREDAKDAVDAYFNGNNQRIRELPKK